MTNYDLFTKRFGENYVPDNSMSDEAPITFDDLESEVFNEWNSSESEFVKLGFEDVEQLLNYVITTLDWEYPSTILKNLLTEI